MDNYQNIPGTYTGTNYPNYNYYEIVDSLKTSDEKARELAVTKTVEYFKEKNVTQEAFMSHLEEIYKFLTTKQ